MGGASAPLWVTIMLGVLAVIGTVGGAWGGQVIAARRDDRRWEREQAREDLRWARERDRLALDRQHDMRKHWAETRLEAYSAYLSVAGEWADKLAGIDLRKRQTGTSASAEELLELDELRSRFRDRAAAVRLVCSAQVREICNRIGVSLYKCYDLIVKPHINALLGVNIPDAFDEHLFGADAEIAKLVELCRDDLGVTIDTTSVRSATPSPPSVPTS